MGRCGAQPAISGYASLPAQTGICSPNIFISLSHNNRFFCVKESNTMIDVHFIPGRHVRNIIQERTASLKVLGTLCAPGPYLRKNHPKQ